MKLLIDANLSPYVAQRLTAAGHDVRHVFEIALGTSTDEEVLTAAAEVDRVVVSSDTDFGTLLARYERTSPSFVLLRHGNELTPDAQVDLLIAALAEAGLLAEYHRPLRRHRHQDEIRSTGRQLAELPNRLATAQRNLIAADHTLTHLSLVAT